MVKVHVMRGGANNIRTTWPGVYLGLLLFTSLALSGPPAALGVGAHVVLTRTGTNFVYMLFNDEPTNSALSLTSFHLTVNAPFEVVSSPPGWTYLTDSNRYVDWFCTDRTAPYSHDIAPGAALGGFAVRSWVSSSEVLGSAVGCWDTGAAAAGTNALLSIEVPSVLAYGATLAQSSAMGSGIFQFDVIGIPGYLYQVETTSNLLDWLGQATNASPFTFVDSGTNAPPARFYRVGFHSDED